MKSFRAPRYLERYEDVVFDTEQALAVNPNDTQYQKRDGIKIVADNTGETTPFDCITQDFQLISKLIN